MAARTRTTAEGVGGIVIALGSGFPLWVGSTEATQTHASLWENGWVRFAAVLWILALTLVAISWGRQAVAAVGAWWHHRNDDENGGDDVPQRPNPKKPKGGRTTPKKERNTGAKDVHQGDHNTNIGKQVNNYSEPDSDALLYVRAGTAQVNNNKFYGIKGRGRLIDVGAVDATVEGNEVHDAPLSIGDDNTIVGGNVPDRPMGSRNTIVGPTEGTNTVLNRGGIAIGTGAYADATSIAIGAGAGAGAAPNQEEEDVPEEPIESGPTAEMTRLLLHPDIKPEADEIHKNHDD